MEISKVRIPSGTVLNIKDASARTRLSELSNVENKNVATIKEEILTSVNVKSALGTGTDDGTFLAKDGTWKVPAGGAADFRGTINVNLQTLVRTSYTGDPSLVSSTDLNGAIVTVTNTTDSETVESKTFAGQQLSFTGLTPLKSYSISVAAGTSNMSKYLAPNSIASIENLGMGATITRNIEYKADQWGVDIDSNQSDKTDIANAKVTYNNVQYDNNSSIIVPFGTDIDVSQEITTTNISGYSSTISKVTTGVKHIDVLYQTEILTVNFALTEDDENDTDLSGQEVTIYNGSTSLGTLSDGESMKIPYGINYTIEVTSEVPEGYKTPDSITKDWTDTKSKSVDITFEVAGDFIDLGLPSGTKWATGNLVKDSQGNYSIGEETDWGTYVSQGNIVGHNNGEGYDFGTSNSGPYASTPGKQVSANIASNDAQHDAALALLGSPWRLPTKEEFQELYDNTDREWTTINGINGWKFMKKTDHSVFVFFPAAGYGYGTSIDDVGSLGLYLSSSWNSDTYAYDMYFNSSSVIPQSHSDRCYGFSVRAVCDNLITFNITTTDESSVEGIGIKLTSGSNSVNIVTDSNGSAQAVLPNGTYTLTCSTHTLSISTLTVSKDATVNIDATKIPMATVTSYIINQTNPSAAAASMIEIDTPAKDNDDVNSVIHRIHSNTKLYGSTGLSDGSLQVKEISRSNKAQFVDGSSVSSSYDVFMKLPEFWWKVDMLATDKYQVSFTMDAGTGAQTGWNHWEGDTFIGCYEAQCSDTSDNTSGVLYSKSGVTPTVNVSQTNFKTKARNKGAGYQIVTYEAHCIMALLGYGWLGTTDDQSVVGYGSSDYPKTTGKCNAKGINDTSASVDGGSSANNSTSTSINFWGLENWWGDLREWIDNIETTSSSGDIKIMDRAGTTVRSAKAGTTDSNCIGKMVLGQYGDMIPKEVHSDSNYTTGFASYGRVYGAAGRVACRSYYGSSAYGGLACLGVGYDPSRASSSIGSRLLYKGSYTEI